MNRTINRVDGKGHRNSSIEILRIIAIVFVCVSHAVYPVGGVTVAEGGFLPYTNVANITYNFCCLLGEIANIIFAICAAYFLFDSTKTRLSKFFNIMYDQFLISVFCLVGMLIGGFKFDSILIVKQFFPTFLMVQHFVTRYLLIYLFHPLINRVVNKWSFKRYSIVVLSIFVIMPFVVNPLLRFFTVYEVSANPFSFLLIYVIVVYFKKYGKTFFDKKINNYAIIAIGLPIFYLLQTLMVFYSSSLTLQYFFVIFTSYYSPFVFLPIYSIFILVSKHHFYSRPINYLTSFTLLIYCFQGNTLLNTYIKPMYFTSLGSLLDGGANDFYFRILLGFIIFFAACVLGIAYRESVQRLTKTASIQTDKLFNRIINHIRLKLNNH